MTLLPEKSTLLLPFRTAPMTSAEPLRVGVVMDSEQAPRWVDSLLTFLRKIPEIDVHLFALATRQSLALKRPPWLTERLYNASRAGFDPFQEAAIPGTAVIVPAGCGVLVWLAAFQDPAIDLRSLAKHGVFTVRLGDHNGAIPFFEEVANNSPTSTTTIFWHDTTFAQGRVVRKAETSTLQGLFFTGNAQQPLIAAIRMIAGLCLEIRQGSANFKDRASAQQMAGTGTREYPSSMEIARFSVNKVVRSAHLRWQNRGKKPNWFVAMRPNDPARTDLSGFKEVPLPKGVEQMADPFLWEAGGEQYLLFEEVAAGQGRGRLGCVEVLPNGSCSEMKIILERPYHLSYPCVVPSNGDLFLMPETAAANRVDIYRFSRFPWEMELISTAIEGAALVDTTPVFVDGHWYFFTTTAEPFMETLLFTSPRLDGKWSLHPGNPVSTSVKSCRSAGQLYWRDGRLYRPTQDCSIRYGYAIVVNEVTKLTPHEFEERRVNYLPPAWLPGLLGTHTWNESSKWQVLDGNRLVSSV